jgi:hypothetical protein
MSRFSPLFKRLQQLEPDPEYIEPWPPTGEGDLASLLYNQMKADGVPMPADHPGGSVLLFLIKLGADRFFADEIEVKDVRSDET